MYYPETQIKIAASSREVRRQYLLAKSYPREQDTPEKLEVLAKLVDPVKRALHDLELDLDESKVADAIQWEQNPWTNIVRYGFGLLALFVFLAPDNLIRICGFALAPNFKEYRMVEHGQFEREDWRGGVVEVSDHRHYSAYSSSSKTWQYMLDHSTAFLRLPVVVLLSLVAMIGSKWLDRLVARRIAGVRSDGEDDTAVRRFWFIFALSLVSLLWLADVMFGYDRVVPVSK